MANMDPRPDLTNRIAELEAKLAARRGKTAYRESVPVIEAELDRLRGTKQMIEQARADGLKNAQS